MEEQKQSNAVLAYEVKNLVRSFDDFKIDNKKDHKELIDHQKETNGRVKKQEEWKSYITGGMAVLSIIVIPILLYIVTTVISNFRVAQAQETEIEP